MSHDAWVCATRVTSLVSLLLVSFRTPLAPDFSDDEDEEPNEDPSENSLVLNDKLIQTVPAKEPHLDAIPLKSALKKNQNYLPVLEEAPTR